MNYLREINAFYDWLETNTLTDSAIALWHALMHVANKAGWPEEFAVAISTLEAKTGLKKDAVIYARNRLQQAGRIKFRSRTGRQSAIYKFVPIETCVGKTETIDSEKPMQIPTQNNCVGKTDANDHTKSTQIPTQNAAINKLNKTKNNGTNVPKAAPNPDVKTFLDHYVQTYQAKFGITPVVNYAKDGKIIKKLLSAVQLDKLKQALELFFNDSDEFLEKAGYTIGVFRTRINAYLTKRPRAAPKYDKFRSLYINTQPDDKFKDLISN